MHQASSGQAVTEGGRFEEPTSKGGLWYRAQFCSLSEVSVFCEHKARLRSPASAFPWTSAEPGDFAYINS